MIDTATLVGRFCPRITLHTLTEGWTVVVRPGFAHESVPVEAWHLIVSPHSGEVLGKEVAARMRGRAPVITALDQTGGEGSWLLTLGVEIEGQMPVVSQAAAARCALAGFKEDRRHRRP